VSKTRSPFTIQRFEHNQAHLYFLPAIMQELAKPKPIYMVGSRGTGKTTLLNALNWRERLENPRLSGLLPHAALWSEFVGVYLKLPKLQLRSIELWLEGIGADRDVHGKVVGTYIDLVWLQELADALSTLVAESHVKFSPGQEAEVVSEIENRYEDTLLSTGPNSVTIRSLSRKLRGARRRIEWLAAKRTASLEMLADLPVEQVGGLGRTVAAQFQNLFPRGASGRRPYFKVCMDEGECLSTFQQVVINTAVRLAEDPVFPVVSYVGRPRDISSTLETITLQKADCDLILLDEMGDAGFRELAAGVASIRVQEALSDSKVSFDPIRTLGKLDINRILFDRLTSSSKTEAKHYLAAASSLRSLPFFNKTGDEDEDTGSAPPVYQAYLIEKLKLRIPDPGEESAQIRKNRSEIERRMVAAFLTLLTELNLAPRYASGKMVLQLSDMCIRDFLAQIEEVLLSSKLDVRDFLQREIGFDVQYDALSTASQKKRQSIPDSAISSPARAGRLVESLAIITERVQCRGSRALDVPERGQFLVEIPPAASANDQAVLEVVREASEAGFLRMLEADHKKLLFRVHTSLAPAFGFSYRGAYHPCRLELGELWTISETADDDDRARYVGKIADRLVGEDDLPLFDSMEGSE
jgi:hypothetical protein